MDTLPRIAHDSGIMGDLFGVKRQRSWAALAVCGFFAVQSGCAETHTATSGSSDNPTVATPVTGRETVAKSARSLQSTIEEAIKGFGGTVGVYVRRLGDETTVSIRADEVFPTASLVKVPILLKVLDRVDKKELSWTAPLVYTKSRLYPGEDLLARFEDNQKVSLPEIIFLMESLSDNTASLWCQELAGGGPAINTWLDGKGFRQTRVNSRTPGREKDRDTWGWGQTTPREMAELLVLIRERRAVSPGADAYADRALGRSYWIDEAISSIPPSTHAITKQGAINASRSEVLLVSAPSGPFVVCVITKNQKDQSWNPTNEGFRLLRNITAICWSHFEADRPFAPAVDGPSWPK